MSAKRVTGANSRSAVLDGTSDGALLDAEIAGEDMAESGVGGVITPRRKARATSADHLEALRTKAPKDGRPIVVPHLDIRRALLTIVGASALICHRFSLKAKQQMLAKQMMEATKGREKKDPQADFRESLYPIPGKPGKYGFPALAFKCACVTACTSLGKAISKVQARQAFHVTGIDGAELVEIKGTPTMREDTVRIGQGIADLRYRGEFKEWSCVLQIEYNARVISLEQLANLLNLAGFGVGVGEWRIERDGQSGRFFVKTDAQ